MTKFETGTEHSTRSICDSECVFTVNIIRRTAKSVWIKDMNGETVRRSIQVVDGAEQFFPYGKYSMAPVIRATRLQEPIGTRAERVEAYAAIYG